MRVTPAIGDVFTGLLLAAPGDPAVPHGAWAAFKAKGVAPAHDRLRFLGRAITPASAPVRFHARFFVADGEALQGLPNLVHLGSELRDFADTAAVISLLDVVVSVDTAVAHLAGALGKPVVILLPYASDFRWMRHRADTPWYPTAKLIRQQAFGDWGSATARLGEELRIVAARAA